MSDTADLVSLRRRLHAHAELFFAEVFTAATVIGWLTPLADEPGVTVRTGADVLEVSAVVQYPSLSTRLAAAERAIAAGVDRALAERLARDGTGVVIDIQGDRPGTLIGVRCDIDALPITESTDPDHLPVGEGFACSHGAMHACGHDGHTAIGLVLARRLAADRDFAGTVRLIFQPAEETCRGAAPMIAAGVADGIDVMLGLHLGEGLSARVLAAAAVGLQATEKFEAEFTGVAAHAAQAPQEGRNAIAAAATATLHLLALSRDARGVTNVNVGTISGGQRSNIVPDHAVLQGEVRSDSTDVCDELGRRVRRVLGAAAEMWGVGVDVTVLAKAGTLTGDAELIDHALAAAASVENVAELRREATMAASDDFADWASAVQAAGGQATFLIVGASSPAPHHSPTFDIDESALPVACDWLEAIIRTPFRRQP